VLSGVTTPRNGCCYVSALLVREWNHTVSSSRVPELREEYLGLLVAELLLQESRHLGIELQ
jgi:hypothetical protein